MTATYPGDGGSAGHADRNPFVRVALAVERAGALDAPARSVGRLADALVASPARRAALQGRWLSHALHPLVVMVPLGTWTSVGVLDLVGGRSAREASRTLTGFGIVTAVPSAVTGLAEFADANARDRRTATVHAAANSAGLGLYVGSWLARRRGRHVRGAVLAAGGLAAVSVGGFLGGHLTETRKVGSHHPAFADD